MDGIEGMVDNSLEIVETIELNLFEELANATERNNHDKKI